MSERYFKVLNSDGSCFHGGIGAWPLPNGKPGKWMPKIEGNLIFCERGYHILKAEHLIDWLGPAIFEVEVDGEVIEFFAGDFPTGVVAPDGYKETVWKSGAECEKCGLRFDPNEGTRDDLYDPDHLNPAKGGNKASDDYW